MAGDTAKKENCALILGGGLNGYCTARELAECGVKNIILTDGKKDYAFFSNKLLRIYVQETTAENILNLILSLQKEFDCVVVYPVSDIFLTVLDEIYGRLNDKRGILLNSDTLHRYYDKSAQYAFCADNDVAYPKTLSLIEYFSSTSDSLQYPLLIKPNSCDKNNYGKVFKTLIVETPDELNQKRKELEKYLSSGIDLLITEMIPGDDDCIYGYTCCRTSKGEIVSEWGWRKLSQFPEGSGVFATIKNEANPVVMDIGRDIFEKMNFYGIGEIEFKYDVRDGKFKYIEANFRGPMFIRLGKLSNVTSCYAQYLYCTGAEIPWNIQDTSTNIHYVFFQAEVVNTIRRIGYVKKMLRNIFKSDKTSFAIFDIRDPLPALMNPLFILADAKRMIKRFM